MTLEAGIIGEHPRGHKLGRIRRADGGMIYGKTPATEAGFIPEGKAVATAPATHIC